MKRGDKKAQLNMSFGWIFAIIVGAAILALTIFGVTKVIKTNQQEQSTVGTSQLSVLFNPLETGFESATSTFISTKVNTRIYNKCLLSGDFGQQRLSLSEYSFDKWTIPSSETSFESKYIFSRDPSEGKRFYLFSKPFESPFKVSDLIYLTSENEKYCFDGAPERIEEEISQIGQPNLASNCTDKKGYRKICFRSSSECDISVNYDLQYVEKKNSEKMYFNDDTLMYAAIFSDKELYECQVQRLIKRTRELASLYNEKAILMSQRNCKSDLVDDLAWLKNLEIKDSSELPNLDYTIEAIASKNKYSYCKLW